MFWNNPIMNPSGKDWYAFGWERGEGRTMPKEYQGPFPTKSAANAWVKGEIERYGKSPNYHYTVRALTREQFEKIWGAPPQD